MPDTKVGRRAPAVEYERLNTLESVVIEAQDSADDARWQQAQIVARLLDAGATQQQIAAEWINGRTGKPYAHQHVSFVKQVWRRWGSSSLERPDWTTAYYTVQTGSDELVTPDDRRQRWSDDHEARAPKSERTAVRLADNLLKAPPEIRRTVAEHLSRDADVRAEVRKRDQEFSERRQPSPIPPREDTTVFQFESRLVGARRYLRDALALANEIDQPGNDEDILDTLGMLKELVDAIDQAYRSGQSLDSWAWELYEKASD